MLGIFHILTDALIALAYYSIPISIYVVLKRKKALSFKKFYWLFILFIFSYGTIHLFHLLGLWIPLDLLSGMVSLITAVVSVLTAVSIWYVLPVLMNYPTTKDLQEVNESLQDERNFVSAVLDTLDAIVVVLDPNRNVVKVNPSFECLTGYTLDDMRGGNFLTGFLHSNQVEKVTERMLNNFNNPELPNRYESHIISKGGDSYFISWSNTVLKGTDGSIKNIISTGIDVTERKQAEDEMRISREYLKDTLREHQGMIFKLNKKNGRFIYTFADGKLLYSLGFSPNKVVGKDSEEIFNSADGYPEETPGNFIDFYRRAWEEEENVRFEYKMLCGMETVTVLNTIKKNGKVTELIGSSTDITKEKRIKKELQNSEKKYRLMAENISDMLIIFDSRGIINYASPSHYGILGYQQDQLVGKSQFNLLHPNDTHSEKELMELLQTIRQVDEPYQAEFRLRHKKGNWIYVEARGMPIRGNRGHVDSFVLVCRDITKQKLDEEIIRK